MLPKGVFAKASGNPQAPLAVRGVLGLPGTGLPQGPRFLCPRLGDTRHLPRPAAGALGQLHARMLEVSQARFPFCLSTQVWGAGTPKGTQEVKRTGAREGLTGWAWSRGLVGLERGRCHSHREGHDRSLEVVFGESASSISGRRELFLSMRIFPLTAWFGVERKCAVIQRRFCFCQFLVFHFCLYGSICLSLKALNNARS